MGLHLLKTRGQYVLRDYRIIRTICETVIQFQCPVFEIGYGCGALTRPLLVQKVPVLGIDIDARFYRHLLTKLPNDGTDAHLLLGDFLKIDFWKSINDWLSSDSKILVLGNLPYFLSKRIIRKLFYATALYPSRVVAWLLMLPRRVGQQFMSQVSKKGSFFALVFQYFFSIQIITVVPPRAFFPEPFVTSIVLQFVPQQQRLALLDQALIQFIFQLFTYRRKTIKNNLHYIFGKRNWILIFQQDQYLLSLRAEQLNFSEAQKLFNICTHLRQNKI